METIQTSGEWALVNEDDQLVIYKDGKLVGSALCLYQEDEYLDGDEYKKLPLRVSSMIVGYL